MSDRPVRVRFAPSPTGMFHVGGARSALYNWAYARTHGGTFLLRIEDTDASRNQPEWVAGIIGALSAIGIDSRDERFEGPVFQSDNTASQQAAAVRLRAAGRAYFCDCTRDEVIARAGGNSHAGYDGHCRDRGLEAGPGRALRFRTPDDGETAVVDLLRGTPTFPNAALDDFVIARADGSPVFLLANVVDDIDGGITHVIRGDEHLPNTPKQQLLWAALGATPPTWAHLPVLVNEKRQKLSKRRDKVALESYLDEGYLPEALVNYLMLLGWGPRDGVEIAPYEALEKQFRIEDVTTSPAFFDLQKLHAFNGDYIRALSPAQFVEACGPWLRPPHATWTADRFDGATFVAAAPLAQTRVGVLGDIVALVDFFFLDEVVPDDAAWTKTMTEVGLQVLASARTALADEALPWAAEDLKNALLAVGEAHGLKLGKAQAPVRVALTGRTVGLPIFESMELLGRPTVLARIDAALSRG